MDVDTEAIYKWIDSYQFSRQKKNINRDFSDAVPLAEILKVHFPKLVDLHNYTPRNSVAHKMINWNTLQRKVLAKLKIHLSKSALEELARSEAGAIERLLSQVKDAIEKHNTKDANEDDVYFVEGLAPEMNGSILPIKMKQGSKVSEKKIVPSELFDEMVKDLEQKDETIKELNTKVKHLESLLHVKDERIEDLQTQLAKMVSDVQSTSASSRFLTNMF